MTRACVALWRAVIFWHGSNLTHRGTWLNKVKQPICFLYANKILNMKSDIRPNCCQTDLFHKAEELYPPMSLGISGCLNSYIFYTGCLFTVLSVCLSGLIISCQFPGSFTVPYVAPCIKKQRWKRAIWHLLTGSNYHFMATFVALLCTGWWKK